MYRTNIISKGGELTLFDKVVLSDLLFSIKHSVGNVLLSQILITSHLTTSAMKNIQKWQQKE